MIRQFALLMVDTISYIFSTNQNILCLMTEEHLIECICVLIKLFFIEPTIRWYRNNEPVRKSQGYEISQNNGEATLKISSTQQEDVAEYKVEASNPVGKASSVTNIVLKRGFIYLSYQIDTIQQRVAS